MQHVAIDLGSKESQVCVRSADGTVLFEKKHPTQPHWYLGILGTDTVHQGKGVGSALMQPILERCDAEGLPAYLESSREGRPLRITGREMVTCAPPDGELPADTWPPWASILSLSVCSMNRKGSLPARNHRSGRALPLRMSDFASLAAAFSPPKN